MSAEDELVQKFDLDQDVSCCGWPGCCPGKTLTFIRPRFPSQRIAEFGVADDIETFLKEAEVYAKQQMKRTKQLIERWNDRFAPQGLYIELKTAVYIEGQVIGQKPGIELRVNLPRRRQYCAENGLAFTESSHIVVMHQPVTTVVSPPPYSTSGKS